MRGRHLGLLLGTAAFGAIAFLPSRLHGLPGLGHRPAYAAATVALMAAFWLFEALPIWATALAPLLLYPLFDVFGAGAGPTLLRTASQYADAYILLFLGGMTLGAAMEQWGLHRRVALHVMLRVGTEPRRLLLGMLLATALVSLWISNTATAVMMLPIAMALIAQLESASPGPRTRLGAYGCALMLAVAYGSNVGGIGTKIGTGTNSIFCGFLAEKLHLEIGFLQYMALGLPFVLLFLPLVWLVLWQVGREDGDIPAQGREVLEHELLRMGPMSAGERRVAAIFGAAALLWVLGDPLRAWIAPIVRAQTGFAMASKHYEAAVALAAAAALLATRTLPPSGLRRLPYSTLVLLGGSFAMAAGIEGSGLSRWLTEQLAAVASLPLLVQVGLTSFATVFLSAVASNTATINVMLSILPPHPAVLSAANLAASCDFMLPAGTPPNAIVFGSGYVRLPTMIRVGFLLDLLAALVITLYATAVGPLVLSAG